MKPSLILIVLLVATGEVFAQPAGTATMSRASDTQPDAHAVVRTVRLLQPAKGDAANQDVIAIGVADPSGLGPLLVLNSRGTAALLHLRTCAEAGGCFKRFGEVVPLPNGHRGLEVVLVDATMRENVQVLTCGDSACEFIGAAPRDNSPDLVAAKQLVDEMAASLHAWIAEVKAAGADTVRIRQIGDTFKKNSEAMKARGEALQGNLTAAEKKHLEAYGREKIGPLMGQLMAAIVKAQAMSTPKPSAPEVRAPVAPQVEAPVQPRTAE